MVKNVLDRVKMRKLEDYILKIPKDELATLTRTFVARKASEELDFQVTRYNVQGVVETFGLQLIPRGVHGEGGGRKDLVRDIGHLVIRLAMEMGVKDDQVTSLFERLNKQR